jgi:hypothetical protein
MWFFQVLSAIGTAVAVASAVQAGRVAREQADAQAAEIEEERITNKIKALQTTNNMLAEYDADTNINEAMLFGLAERDPTDRSLSAFFKKQNQIIAEDVKTATRQGIFEDDKLERQAMSVRASGRARESLSYIQAVNYGVNGYLQYKRDGYLGLNKKKSP